eukprot:EG_transcript_34069
MRLLAALPRVAAAPGGAVLLLLLLLLCGVHSPPAVLLPASLRPASADVAAGASGHTPPAAEGPKGRAVSAALPAAPSVARHLPRRPNNNPSSGLPASVGAAACWSLPAVLLAGLLRARWGRQAAPTSAGAEGPSVMAAVGYWEQFEEDEDIEEERSESETESDEERAARYRQPTRPRPRR